MRSTKRIILSLIVLMLVAFVLCACNVQTNPPSDGTTDTTTTAGTIDNGQPYDLVLLENGEFKFKVIRPEFEAEDVVAGAAYLRTELSNLVGSQVAIGDDYLKKGDEHDHDTYEILFGRTSYSESTEIYEGLNYGTYRIAVKGNKIVIAACDGNAAGNAAFDFVQYVKSLIKDGNAVISSEYSAEKAVNPLTSRVPVYKFGKFNSTYTGAHNDVGFVYTSTSLEDFNNYVTDSTANGGCTLYASSQMGNNHSATLTSGDAIINVFFTAADKNVRLIVESSQNTSLPAAEKDRNTAKVCDSVMVQLGLEQPYDGGQLFTPSIANFQIGMCYIFRLYDGSFILIDGGFNRTQNADMIYNKLKELAPDKNNIVISAWIFSHQHGDHMGAYKKFTEKYASKVTLKNIIYNFATSKELSGINESSGNTTFVSGSYANYKGCQRVVAHPGQIFYYSNMKIEVLHTMDLLRPRDTYAGGNSFNTAVKITIEGQTYMFAGDSHTDMTACLVKNYGSYLKSDFVQVVHHGAPGASNAFYQAVDPTIVVWPLGAWDYYPWRRNEEYHTYLFTSKNVKEIVLAASTDRQFNLPYTFPTELVLPPEIEVTWDYTQGK